jgi:choline kinase
MGLVAEVQRALFIAAGRGVRLGERGRLTPKGLLRIGETTLMERAIALLRDAGVHDITIITGYLRELYDALVSRVGGGLKTIFNPDYASHGAARSLAVGLEAVSGPLLLLESDILWESRALDAIFRSPFESSLLTSGPTGAGDEVWVWPADAPGRPVLEAMSKDRSFRKSEPFGELVGMARIGEALRGELLATIRRAERHDVAIAYETCLSEAAVAFPVDLLRIDDLAWGEVDDEGMYARVRDIVWPSILSNEHATGRSRSI